NLRAGITYRIFAVGQVDTTVNAGLYSAVVSPTAGGSPAFSRMVPIGSVAPIASASLSAADYSLRLADLAYPPPLTQSAALIARDGVVAARLTAPGSAPFTVTTAGNYSLFAVATPAPTGPTTALPDYGTGSYVVEVRPSSGPAVLSAAHAVSTPGAGM